MKKWRDSDFECPDCGNTVMVETAAEEGYYYDGDDLYCPVCHCEGQVIIDGDDAWDHWDY
jgi:Zn finger protein HypA/HybF involved in hydrogenase expression